MSPGLYTKFPGVKLDIPRDCWHPGMDERMTALEERMQQLQETARRALTQRSTFQVRLLRADLTRT